MSKKGIQKIALVVLLLQCFFFYSRCSVVSEIRSFSESSEIALPEFRHFDGIKRHIAVVDFRNETARTDTLLGSAISDMIIAALTRSGYYSVIDRSMIDEVLHEQALGQAGYVSESSAARVGHLLGAHALLSGEITKIRINQKKKDYDDDEEKKDTWSFALQATIVEVEIYFELINTSTGEIIAADDVRAVKLRPGFGIRTEDWEFNDFHEFDQSLLGKAFREAAHSISIQVVDSIREIDWFGKIIKLSASQDTLFFTPGKSSGITIGSTFNVYEKYPDDFESSAGQSIARIRIFNFIGQNVCEAIIEEGEGIAVGDLVREIPQRSHSHNNSY